MSPVRSRDREGKRSKRVVAVSGGFDPLHRGHIALFKASKRLGDELVVILNNDHWLRSKKGAPFMSERDRAAVLKGLRFVDRVMLSFHGPDPRDMSVSQELQELRPDIFANGGDRTMSTIPEKDICRRLGITLVFNVGGGKVQSSSGLLSRYAQKTNHPRGRADTGMRG